MLSCLRVENLAVVERTEVEFAPGLNVLTGETGAGKSVLIGALDLVLGARAATGAVRDGEKEAKVEAVFTLDAFHAKDAAKICEDAGIDFNDGEALIIRRTVKADGGGRIWINDQSATAALLRKLARLLVDIHGPRANQSILEEAFQRACLDSFGKIDVAPYAERWREWNEAREQLEALESDEVSPEELDTLSYQVSEIEEAGITGEDDTIEERHNAAFHAGEIISDANSLTEAIGGENGLEDIAASARQIASRLAKHTDKAADWVARLENIIDECESLSREVGDVALSFDTEGESLETLEERLAVVNRLKRKYIYRSDYVSTPFSAAMEEILSAKKARLELLQSRDEKIAEARAKCNALFAELEKAGDALRIKREKAGKALEANVTRELKDLGFLQSRFALRIDKATPHRTGADKVVFLFEPNPGMAARALDEIASSGEMARVMLALKSVLALHDKTDVLVFDEIDANIGGEIGRAVGVKLRNVAKDHQVIAITHLPQSASCGQRHLVAVKRVTQGKTRTSIGMVAGEERVAEIARMLGAKGAQDVVAYAHARSLLED